MRIITNHILCDLDGTLVNSTPLIARTWNDWALRNNLNPHEVELVSRGRTASDAIRILLGEREDLDQLIYDFVQQEILLVKNLSPIHSVADFLSQFPIENWGVVTSATTALAIARLKASALPIPKVLITSDLIERGKPSPDGYLAAAKRLNCRPQECLVFEDSENGVLAATQAGMRVVLVNNANLINGVSISIPNFQKVQVKKLSVGFSIEFDSYF